MSEYDGVAGGALKLKGVSDHSIKKKKKKKNKKKEKEKIEKICSESAPEEEAPDQKDSAKSNAPDVPRRTKAEKAFRREQDKRREESVMMRASKTHKERIMEFNGKLDDLSEHYDIPKVSWTK